MAVARTSNAPLKMYGNPKTLFTWLGWSERPVAIMISLRTEVASLYEISGSGLAKAKTIGSFAIAAIISLETSPALERPRKTSASLKASSKESSQL